MQPSTRRQARPSKQRKELNRITLVDELKAIEYVDDDYRLKEVHDTINEDAFHARQARRSEILGLLATEAPYCPKHSVRMICPKCIASSGGRRTTTKYRDRLSSWGKMGGRGKRKGFSLCPASTASDFARTLEQSSRKRKAASMICAACSAWGRKSLNLIGSSCLSC